MHYDYARFFPGVILTGAILTYDARIEAILARAILTGAILTGAIWLDILKYTYLLVNVPFPAPNATCLFPSALLWHNISGFPSPLKSPRNNSLSVSWHHPVPGVLKMQLKPLRIRLSWAKLSCHNLRLCALFNCCSYVYVYLFIYYLFTNKIFMFVYI